MHTPSTIRDAINDNALAAVLRKDPKVWDQVCVAMDVLSDRGHIPDQLDAINVLARVVGVPVLAGATSQPEIDAGIDSVGDALADRVRDLHREFARHPLSAGFQIFKDLGYATEKIAKVASDPVFAAAYLPLVRELAEGIRDGLNDRGLWGDDHTSEILTAVRRLTAFTDHAAGAPYPDDAALIGGVAMPNLLNELREIVDEVDADDASR